MLPTDTGAQSSKAPQRLRFYILSLFIAETSVTQKHSRSLHSGGATSTTTLSVSEVKHAATPGAGPTAGPR